MELAKLSIESLNLDFIYEIVIYQTFPNLYKNGGNFFFGFQAYLMFYSSVCKDFILFSVQINK
jgi:hypothetical protein